MVVDKPAGVTSHDVVGMLRRRFHERQVGHGGTLDPDATGVLVVAVGSATRLLRYVEATTKRYTGRIVLGTATSTLDAAGEVTGEWDMSSVTPDDARRVVAEHLVGDIAQVPPMVSALKVGGVRLHELARQGIEVERPPRPVRIERFDVADDWTFEVDCSPGTYVRTLVDDLGRLLGGGAHLDGLRRTAVGRFTLDLAAPPDTAELLPADTAVADLARVDVPADVEALVDTGRVLPGRSHGFVGDGPWAVYGANGLRAVYERFDRGDGLVKPAVVLAR